MQNLADWSAFKTFTSYLYLYTSIIDKSAEFAEQKSEFKLLRHKNRRGRSTNESQCQSSTGPKGARC